MDHVKITEDKLSMDEVTLLVTSPTSGAISVFMGTTRDNFEGKKVTRLEYECYAPMAEQEMLKICRQIRNKWDVENIVILHRIGEVPVCEGSVIVAVSAPHRKESLEAVHYAIDTLKAQVPVWKKEFYEDETYSWKENCECSWKK
ncbi:molybdopterin synthase catalytic subunit-like [Liolophura sinensis]|uniref:molybdopterin synthase catalytic subunit-like n=1 Tax=Liolophura sinensis TaxID=3198878 RepID=UPI0031585958